MLGQGRSGECSGPHPLPTGSGYISNTAIVWNPDTGPGDSSELFTPDVFVEQIAQRDSRSVAARLGAWPEWGLTALGLGAVVVAVRLRRNSTGVSGAR